MRIHKWILKNWLLICFLITTFAVLLYRITLHADLYDEIINLNVSYRIALGQIPFYECWESYQSGDILLSIFLWIYIKVFKTTSGIVLYSRGIYLLLFIILGYLIYRVFKNIISRKKAFLLGYLCIFFQLYGLYYLWYDSVSVYFMTLGCLFLFDGYNQEKKYKGRLLVYFAGVFHGIMSFAYPSFAILAICIGIIVFIYTLWNQTLKKSIEKFFFYIIGGSTIVLIFVLYTYFIIGIYNFQKGITTILSYRSFSSRGKGFILTNIIFCYAKVNFVMMILGIFLLILFFICIKNKKYVKYLIFGIIFVPFLNQLFVQNEYKGLGNYLSYIAIWAPFIFFLLEKKKNDCQKAMLAFMWLPSILSSLCIAKLSVSADIGPVKSWQGFFCGSIVTIVFICLLADQSVKEFKLVKKLYNLIIPTIILIQLTIFCTYIYLNQECANIKSERVNHGIYKGIKSTPLLNTLLDLEYAIDECKEDAESIMVGSSLRSIYLMTDLKPATPSVESPNYYIGKKVYWDMTLKYFQEFQELPDMIVLERNETKAKPIAEILREYYDEKESLNIGNFDIIIYKETKNNNVFSIDEFEKEKGNNDKIK